MLLWLESDRPCYKLSNHGLAFIVDISQSGCILDLMESGIWSMSGDQFHQYNRNNETMDDSFIRQFVQGLKKIKRFRSKKKADYNLI